MGNIPNQTVICQCLEWLKVDRARHRVLDYRSQKLFTGSSILLFVESALQHRSSYHVMSEHLASNPEFQQFIGLKSISASQLSRKLKQLPTEHLQSLFFSILSQIQQQTQDKRGISSGIGKLKLLDSSEITLPPLLAKWAYCSKTNHGVKLHTTLVVLDKKTMFPDQVVVSTTDVADHEVALEFTVDPEATYVMDRGYQVYHHFEQWLKDGIRFVARVKEKSRLTIVEERELPKRHGKVTRDAWVHLPNSTSLFRLIEFTDNHGRNYRLLTNRFDLSACQIAEIYRNRWHIELFFKWVKQHLRLVKLHGYTPEAIWNQIYLALIAYALCLLIKLTMGLQHTVWNLLQTIRIYANRTLESWLSALHREPTRTSRGRPKRRGGRPKIPKKSMKPRLILR